MDGVRYLFQAHRAGLVVLLACTLLVRLIVPSGFMPEFSHGTVQLSLCSGMTAAPSVPMAMPGMHHGDDSQDKGSKSEAPCGFAGAGLATIDAVAPVLLAAALAFAFLLASRATPLSFARPPARLRPPLRAPPPIA